MARKAKYKPKEYEALIETAFQGSIKVVEKYQKEAIGILHQCNQCFTEWRAEPRKLLTPTGAKKAKFGCPNCAKGQPTNIVMSKNEFRKAMKQRYLDDARAGIISVGLKFSGEYRGTNVPIKTECLSCGKKDLSRPRLILSRKYLCTCVNPINSDCISQQESKRLGYLYKSAFLNFKQLAKLSGYNEGILRKIAHRDNWIETKKNQFKSDRYARQRRFVEGGSDIRKKQYSAQVRRITGLIYGRYKHIIDPKGLRGKDYELDHMFSIHEAYFRGPVDVRYLCHPANLQMLTREDNAEKRTRSDGVHSLKKRIRTFNKKYGKVNFPAQYQYNYTHCKPDLSTEKGLKVLGFDPGITNFGCYSGVLLGESNLRKVFTKESSMLLHPLTGMTTLQRDLGNFKAEIKSYIDTYKPNAIVIERFMSRGMGGATIELVNIMIGVILSLLSEYKEKGHSIYIKVITAATWKNQVNRITELGDIYESARNKGVVDHLVDSALQAAYAFPTKENPYAFLYTAENRKDFIQSLVDAG